LAGLQRGVQARPGPCARWCFTLLSLLPQSSHSWLRPDASIRGLPSATRGAPTHSKAQHTGASLSAGCSLHKLAHHPDARTDLVVPQQPAVEEQPAPWQQQRQRRLHLCRRWRCP
jgi:hypothetical protein